MSNTMQVTLHRDDIQLILELIDKVNPNEGDRLEAGLVTLHVDSSSGIGSIVIAELPATVNGMAGTFRQQIIDERNW